MGQIKKIKIKIKIEHLRPRYERRGQKKILLTQAIPTPSDKFIQKTTISQNCGWGGGTNYLGQGGEMGHCKLPVFKKNLDHRCLYERALSLISEEQRTLKWNGAELWMEASLS